MILMIGLSLWFLLKWSDSRLFAIGLILVPVLYMATRASGIWTGEQAVEVIRMLVNDLRADSLKFRMDNENALAKHVTRHRFKRA